MTAPLVKKIIEQDQVLSYEDLCDQIAAKREVRRARRQHQEEAAKELRDGLPKDLARAVELGSEKGASSWLSVVPIKDHGFALHKHCKKSGISLVMG